MFDAAADPQVSAASAEAERDARVLAWLAELAAIGMTLARELARRAAGDEVPPEPAEAALAFSRLSRAVRLTLALELRLAQDGAARAEAAEHARRARDGHERAMRAAGRKDEAQALVERALAAEGRDEIETEDLVAELSERLDEDDDEAWLDDTPVAVLAARICRDLGVAFDPALWTGDGGGDEASAPPDPPAAPSSPAAQAHPVAAGADGAAPWPPPWPPPWNHRNDGPPRTPP